MFKEPYPIVTVDDQEDIGIIIGELIKLAYKESVEIINFTSSEAALEHIANHDVMILITDLELPGLHGLDLIQKVNQLSRGIQTIVVTGHQSYSNALECFMAGVHGYITKPLTQSQLKLAIDQCLQRLHYWDRILNHVEAI